MRQIPLGTQAIAQQHERFPLVVLRDVADFVRDVLKRGQSVAYRQNSLGFGAHRLPFGFQVVEPGEFRFLEKRGGADARVRADTRFHPVEKSKNSFAGQTFRPVERTFLVAHRAVSNRRMGNSSVMPGPAGGSSGWGS